MGLDPGAPEMTFLLVMLHTGTMFAVLLYFWPRWKKIWAKNSRAFVRHIAVATVVTGVVGFGLKIIIEKLILERWLGHSHGEIESLFRMLPLIAFNLLAAGVLILVSSRFERGSGKGRAPELRGRSDVDDGDSLIIGGVQAICLPLRGFSRSGATISAALMRGVSRAVAEDFSFALAVVLTPPVILLELKRLLKAGAETGAPSMSSSSLIAPACMGMVFSFIAGLAALRLLSSWLESGRWRYFGIYCVLGAAGVCVLYLGTPQT